MERAINVAKGRGSTLDQMENVKLASQSLPANRFAEAHLDLTQLMPMMMMMAMGAAGMQGQMPSPPEGGAVPISMSASAQTNTLRADLVVPTASIKALMEMAMQMGGGPGGPQHYEDDDSDWDEDVEEDF